MSCRVIAHRGARAYAPENTLEAIDLAARQRADAVEVDVRPARDGEIVVMHDDTLVRTTDAARRFPGRAPWSVSDFTAAELATLDAGAWYADAIAPPPAARVAFLRTLGDAERDRWVDRAALHRDGSGVRIPTLAAVLDRCRAHGLALHVELKSTTEVAPGFVERVVALVAGDPHADATRLSSFDQRLLARVRALHPTLRTALLVDDRPADPLACLASLGATALHPRYDDALDRAWVAGLTDAGHEVNVWTVNDPDRMRRLVEAGVTGIFTDYPDRLRRAIDAPEEST